MIDSLLSQVFGGTSYYHSFYWFWIKINKTIDDTNTTNLIE